MKVHRLIAASALLVVLGLGVVLGAVGERLRSTEAEQRRLARGPAQARRVAVLASMGRRLQLTADQRAHLERLLDAQAPEYVQVARAFRQGREPLRRRLFAELRPALSAEQQAELDRLSSEVELPLSNEPR